MLLKEIKEILEKNISDSEVVVDDPNGDNKHLSVYVRSKVFAGKSRVESQRIVMNFLKDHFNDGRLHALQIKTEAMEG